MTSLWTDGWFYISGGGFLVSSMLFVFLLGQYRAAVEAEDEGEEELPEPLPVTADKPEKLSAPKPVATDFPSRPAAKPAPAEKSDKTLVMPPEDKPGGVVPVVSAPKKEATVASVAAKPPPPQPAEPLKAAPAPAPAAATPFAGPERRKTDSTGGISPAVAYMQNIKNQMEHLDKEIVHLKSLAAQQSAQGDAILKRLAELTEKMTAAQSAAASAPPQPAPAAAIEQAEALVAALPPEPSPAPAAVSPAPAPIPAPAPAPEPAATQPTMVIEPTVAIERFSRPPKTAKPAPQAPPAQPPSPQPGPDLGKPPIELKLEEPQPPVPAPAPAPAAEPASQPPAQAQPPAAESKPARKGPVWPI